MIVLRLIVALVSSFEFLKERTNYCCFNTAVFFKWLDYEGKKWSGNIVQYFSAHTCIFFRGKLIFWMKITNWSKHTVPVEYSHFSRASLNAVKLKKTLKAKPF